MRPFISFHRHFFFTPFSVFSPPARQKVQSIFRYFKCTCTRSDTAREREWNVGLRALSRRRSDGLIVYPVHIQCANGSPRAPAHTPKRGAKPFCESLQPTLLIENVWGGGDNWGWQGGGKWPSGGELPVLYDLNAATTPSWSWAAAAWREVGVKRCTETNDGVCWPFCIGMAMEGGLWVGRCQWGGVVVP